jgi:microcystin degradation protein MlrC
MKRILLAGLFHETHTFVDEVTSLKEFQILRDAELLTRKGDGSPLGGFLEVASKHDWRVIPTVDYRAQPSGTVKDEVVETFWREFEQRAAKPLSEGVDAIYLVLHGAMVAESLVDVEGEILERIRKMNGAATVPLFGVFDLHAHFTARMALHSNCLVAYRENPHTDACAMAVRAAELLEECLRAGSSQYPQAGCPCHTSWKHSGIMWPPTGTGTASTPMRDLEALARELEAAHPNFLAVNIVAGFSFADTPDTGVSFTVCTTGNEAEALAALDVLSALAWKLRHEGNTVDAPLDEVLRKLSEPCSGLTVVVEPSDNIGGGAPGDCTGLLRAFVKHKICNAAVCINDPEAVRSLEGLAVGSSKTLSIGGRGSRLDEGPVVLDVTLVSRSDGRFRLEDKQSHLASMYGDAFDMGPCAVVRHEGVTILLTSTKTPPFDLGQWRSQGIEPEKLSVIGVKAAVAHRRAYDPIAARMLWVDTPGPCRSDLSKLPFKKVRRPVFPLL